jgi:hypothetical protein
VVGTPTPTTTRSAGITLLPPALKNGLALLELVQWEVSRVVAYISSLKPFQFWVGIELYLLEQLHRIDEGLHHAEYERDADKAPCKHEMQCCGFLVFSFRGDFFCRAESVGTRIRR